MRLRLGCRFEHDAATPTAATSGEVKVTRGTAVTSAARRRPSTALAAAVAPCTPATWVNWGCPVTSPAAQIRGLLVRRCASTVTNPRSPVATPAASSPRPRAS